MSLLPASIKRMRSKTTEKRWRHRFPDYKPIRAFYCHGNQSFDLICPKTLCILSPTPVILHIKFDPDWPTGFNDIQVWKCGRQRTEDGPLVYYKLTLWAFSSGGLKIKGWIRAAAWFRYTRYIHPFSTCVTSFNLLGLTVLEKKLTKNFNVRKLERKKNEKKGQISISCLIPVYTIHLPTVHLCTKFQSSRPHNSWEKCEEIF